MVSKKDIFKDSNTSPREYLVKIIIILGMLVDLLSVVEDFLILHDFRSSVVLLFFFCVLAFSHFIIIKWKKYRAAEIIIGIVANLFLFPAIFILGGGLSSGAAIWLVLGLFYIIGMFNGILCAALITLTIFADAATICFAYLNPEKVTVTRSAAGYMDLFFAILAVGLFLGIINKFLLNSSNRARENAERQKIEIEKLSDVRTGFFSNISHEIRTPINSIIGLNEMIIREPNCSNEIRENAILVQNASKMLVSMVNDVLDYSKIEQGSMKLHYVKYNFKTLLYEILSIIESPAKEKGLEFIVNVDASCPSEFCGDEKRIKQVLLNILTNAVKYTKEGKVIFTVNYELQEDNKCKLTFIVSDTGIGIKSENLSKIFEAFTQVETGEDYFTEGTGLGLSISKQLINLMGGRISVDSIYTKGSAFTILIEQSIENMKPVGSIDVTDLTRRMNHIYKCLFVAPEARILVVDDSEMNRNVVCKLLKNTKVNIDQAQNGFEALEYTKQKYYDVILLDYMMPALNGMETMEKIRKQENGLCRDSAIIGMTAIAETDVFDTYENYRFDAVIEKPFGGFTLESMLINVLPSSILEVVDEDARQDANFKLENMASNINKKRKLMITSESVCDLPEHVLAEYGMKQAHMYINTPTGRFRDTREIDVFNVLEDGNLDKFIGTALTVEDYEHFFAECLTEAEEVLHIALGKNMGESYYNACQAAKCFDNVTVVDSGQLSCGLGMMVMIEGIVMRQGASMEELISKNNVAKNEIYTRFLAPTPDCLFKYGYAGKLVKILGRIFHLHPVLTVKNSGIKVNGFMLGDINKAYIRFINHTLRKYKRIKVDGISVSHAGLSAETQDMIEKAIKDIVNSSVFVIQQSSVTNACFAGVGTIGISLAIKSKEN